MKLKNILLPLCYILITSFIYGQQGYEVRGNIQGLSDGELKLVKQYDGTLLDQTTSENGIFIFKKEGKFLGDKVVLKRRSEIHLPFYLEPGEVKINGDISKPDEIIAYGTPSNDAYNKYLQAVAPIEKRQAEIRKQIKETTNESLKKKLGDELSTEYASFYQLRKDFAKKYNNTILAPEFLSGGTGGLTYNDMKELLAGLDPNTAENWYTNRLKERCEILRQTDFGMVPPDFTLPNPEGKQISLSSLKGNIVLVDFWASWCAPCRAENKNVLKLYEKYHKSGFDVISVSIDNNRDKWIKAIRDDQLPWNHVSSLTGWECPVAKSLGVAYGMSGVPYTLLLDREGRVIGHNIRGEDLAIKLKEIFENE